MPSQQAFGSLGKSAIPCSSGHYSWTIKLINDRMGCVSCKKTNSAQAHTKMIRHLENQVLPSLEQLAYQEYMESVMHCCRPCLMFPSQSELTQEVHHLQITNSELLRAGNLYKSVEKQRFPNECVICENATTHFWFSNVNFKPHTSISASALVLVQWIVIYLSNE
ncbi:hypothetical protein P5673_008055 [Acropora cervicornis]|uniref:Uncharacterized protein n=1 Tax=Acropora cervicornis TaxID=6130 RepID=A0AAD9QW14_ACRCE|nr:hypothetical protein P5673_008055 [Acropora cervicornis]